MLHDTELIRARAPSHNRVTHLPDAEYEPDVPVDCTRKAVFAPSTYDREKRTLLATITTGAGYPRRDRSGAYTEYLDVSAIDPPDVVGLPVLDSHRQDSVRHTLGKVIAARRDGDAIVATIQFSAAPDVAPIIDRVVDGTLGAVSIGYRVDEWRESGGGDARFAAPRKKTAVRWKILEVSFVPLGADPGATTRKESTMENDLEVEEAEAPETNRAERNQAIRSIARESGLSHDWADAQIDGDADLTAVRAAALAHMQARSAVTVRAVQTGPSGEDPAVILDRRTRALTARITGDKPDDDAREFVTDSIADHARALLAMHGEPTRGTVEQVLTRAAQHTTSDFSELTTGVGNRVLAGAYQRAQSPIRSVLTRQRTANDFRPLSVLKIGEFSGLQPVSESGEIQAMTTGEAKEGYGLESFGGRFNLSRKAIVNDDLHAFGRWNEMMGRAAAEREAAQLVALLTANSGTGPIMSDGEALFHEDHGNVAESGGDIIGAESDLSALEAARKAMRKQTALDGVTPINVTPKYLLVSPERETEAERALAAIYAATAETANPFTGRLSILVEPRLADDPWYVFADPGVAPVLECAYLSGAEGPQLASRDGWEVLGREFRVVLDFGCGVTDHRGAYLNPGS